MPSQRQRITLSFRISDDADATEAVKAIEDFLFTLTRAHIALGGSGLIITRMATREEPSHSAIPV